VSPGPQHTFALKVLEPCADFSRKAAKAQSAAAFQQFSLRLCAFAWESFFSHGNLNTFCAKPHNTPLP
jgi:hypothetical protein